MTTITATITAMEPMLPEESMGLENLAIDLVGACARLIRLFGSDE